MQKPISERTDLRTSTELSLPRIAQDALPDEATKYASRHLATRGYDRNIRHWLIKTLVSWNRAYHSPSTCCRPQTRRGPSDSLGSLQGCCPGSRPRASCACCRSCDRRCQRRVLHRALHVAATEHETTLHNHSGTQEELMPSGACLLALTGTRRYTERKIQIGTCTNTRIHRANYNERRSPAEVLQATLPKRTAKLVPEQRLLTSSTTTVLCARNIHRYTAPTAPFSWSLAAQLQRKALV